MSWFGYGTPEQRLLDFAKELQAEEGLNDKEVIEKLAKVIQYFAEEE